VLEDDEDADEIDGDTFRINKGDGNDCWSFDGKAAELATTAATLAACATLAAATTSTGYFFWYS